MTNTPPLHASLHLGCPSWGFKDWRGNLYRRDTRPADYLRQYASVFDAVEGNTTFYSLPEPSTVERWREAVPPSFRFCFKIPRWITHDKGLRDADDETAEFFRRLAPLGDLLGPFMVQLPASLGPQSFDVLQRYLRRLPREFRFAVELRHLAFYRGPMADRIRDLFDTLAVGRVVLDTRALRSGDPRHPDVLAARHKKPDLPVTTAVTGDLPFVRFVGHPEAPVDEPWLERWAETLSSWIDSGHHPYFFTHCPNDLYAPPLARRLVELLRKRGDVSPLPPWPGEEEPPIPRQLGLF